MENSVYTAGLYFRAQVLRHAVTHCRGLSAGGEAGVRIVEPRVPDECGRGKRRVLLQAVWVARDALVSPDQHLRRTEGPVGVSPDRRRMREKPDRPHVSGLRRLCPAGGLSTLLGRLGRLESQEPDWAFNSVLALIPALAWHVSRERRFLDQMLEIGAIGRWNTETELDCWRQWGQEWVLINEQNHVSNFVLDAGEVLLEIAPSLFDPNPASQQASWRRIAEAWWRCAQIGMNDQRLVHYWKQINTRTGQWRPTGLVAPEGLDPRAKDFFVKHQSDAATAR